MTISVAEIRVEEMPSVNETEGRPEALVTQTCEGSVDAFEELVRQFENRIYGYLFQLTRNAHDAEDLAQITFVKAYRNLRSFKGPNAFAPWLFTIAKRTALNYLRDRKPVEELNNDHRADAEDPATSLESKEEQASIWRVARRLPSAQYEALWLRYGEGFSIREVAKVMHTTQTRVRILLFRGRHKLATWLRVHRGNLISKES